MLPEVFSGEGDFDEWVSHFESVSAVNGWTDNENLLWIRVRLTGKLTWLIGCRTRLSKHTPSSPVRESQEENRGELAGF